MPTFWPDLADRVLRSCIDRFARPVSYWPIVGSQLSPAAIALRGVYDDAQFLADVGGTEPVSTTEPLLGIRYSEFPAGVRPAQGDELELVVFGETRRYEVFDVLSDGQAGAKLVLKRKRRS